MCLKVFRNYLEVKEKGKSEYLDEIMKIYLKSFKDPQIDNVVGSVAPGASIGGATTLNFNQSQSTNRQVFMEYIKRLDPSFERFKGTKAYYHLYKKVKEFEDISEKVYE